MQRLSRYDHWLGGQSIVKEIIVLYSHNTQQCNSIL